MGSLNDLSMDDFSAIRKMSQVQAVGYLEKFELNSVDYERVQLLIGKDLQTDPIKPAVGFYEIRRKWLCAAWLLGASFRQLAWQYHVSSPTIISAVDKILPQEIRQSMRIGKQMSISNLMAFHKRFEANVDELIIQPPEQIAKWLLNNTELDTL